MDGKQDVMEYTRAWAEKENNVTGQLVWTNCYKVAAWAGCFRACLGC